MTSSPIRWVAFLLMTFVTGGSGSIAAEDGSMAEAVSAYQAGKYAEAEAVWLRMAEQQSDPAAMFLLGVLATQGHLSSGGMEAAIGWYRQAADKGHPAALYNLGILHWNGQDVPQDKAKAVEYWRRAAELNMPDAQYNLAAAYLNGEGTAADLRKARFWLERAADNGQLDAIEALQRLTEVELAQGPAKSAVKAPVVQPPTPVPTQSESSETPSAAAISQPPAAVEKTPETRPPVAKAPSAGIGKTVKIYGYRSKGGEPLATLAPGSRIEVVGREGDWLMVRAPESLSGWVSAEFLDLQGDSARVTSNVRVRLLPEVSTRGAPLAEGLREGEKVLVLEKRTDWVRVRLPARFAGWLPAGDLPESMNSRSDDRSAGDKQAKVRAD